MRSNGAVHIGNDVFLAVTRDVTDKAFLFSSSFPPREQLAPLPLNRKTRFHPHASLACSGAELNRYAESSARVGYPTEYGSDREAEFVADASTPLFHHSAHASPDGRKIAFISNVRRYHYIMDISVVPAAVCELEMPEVVQSVCWHTVEYHALCVLFTSGNLTIYDTDQSYLGVTVPRHRRITLRPAIERALAEAEAYEHPFPATRSTSSATVRLAKNAPASDNKGSQSTRPKPLAGEISTPRRSTASPAHATTTAATDVRSITHHSGDADSQAQAASYRVNHAKSLTSGMIATASHIAHSPRHVVPAGTGHGEVLPLSGTDKVSEEGTTSPPPSPKPATLPTSQLDLVGMYALPPTESIPAILLLLSSSGDVYAVHLRDDCLPVVAAAEATNDGRVHTCEEEALRKAEVAAVSLNVEVHHLISGDDTVAAEDEALAVAGCLVDMEAGTHAVFFCTANGLVKGAWVSGQDLLARHRVAHVRAAGRPNISFTLHTSDSLGVRASLAPSAPPITHGASMTLSQNVCVMRSGASGEVTFVIAFPHWDRRRQGWTCWRPPCSDAQERARKEAALPLVSTDAAPPPPIVLRLPYDTSDASVAVGCTELALVPEVSVMDGSCRRRNILAISLATLLRSALYARCGKLQLHPSAGSDATSRLRDPQPVVLDMLNALPECHRRWLRGFPQAEISAATLDLVRRIEELSSDMNRREAVQAQRRQRIAARLAGLEGRVAEMDGKLTQWHQTILDGIVHRRGGEAFRTANERLGKVFTMLNELEQRL
ncbi:hypothetical protein Q4I32_004395 [Leishmania shawi]|uniref:Uncharacterized protein n=1 Tax=Leishmania shawi TaxID=5680 RepID=A0AAW3BP10_9TRYP